MTSSPLTEENYQRLLALFAKRDSLVSEQKFTLLFQMTLQRNFLTRDQILALDMQDGNRLVGVFLKKPAYAGKLRRKELARQRLQAIHDQEREDDLRPRWGPEKVQPKGRRWEDSSYVVFDPPLYPPEIWLDRQRTWLSKY